MISSFAISELNNENRIGLGTCLLQEQFGEYGWDNNIGTKA